MEFENRQLALLAALVQAEELMREQRQVPEFLLFSSSSDYFLKPSIEDEDTLRPSESDIHDLADKGYLRLLKPGRSIAARFSLTEAGRAAGQGSRRPTRSLTATPPDPDDLLAWIAHSQKSNRFQTLETGVGLLDAAGERFGEKHGEVVARGLLDLAAEGLITFDDPSAGIDQISAAQRIRNAGEFRLTAHGRDRVRPQRASQTSITQTINAVNAQVAAGDIRNFVSLEQLLDAAAAQLEGLEDVTASDREEARSILGKLRGSSATITTGAATGAGGAVLGAVFKNLLGLE